MLLSKWSLASFRRVAPIDLTVDVSAGQRPFRVCQFPGSLFAVKCVLDGRIATVPEMTWDIFLDANPRSHLVVAWLHVRQRDDEVRRARFDLLKRVAAALEPRGNWAMTDANPREIYIAYEKAADAAQLCALVHAKSLGPSLQWLSQSAFRLDTETQRLVRDRLKA